MFLLLLAVANVRAALAPVRINVTASGSTFVAKLVVAWETWMLNKTNGLINIGYVGSGSGGGRADFISGKNNASFSCSDAPLSAAEYTNATASLGTVLQIPWALGAIVPIHSVKTTNKLLLTMDELARVFQGTRTSWNEAPLRMTAMLAPLSGNTTITVVRRNDSSGSTFAFTDALNRGASSTWKLGASGLPKWQNGTVSAQGTSAVIAAVKSIPNAIGYCEYGQAIASNVGIVRVRNAENVFLTGDPEATASAAASTLRVIPDAASSLTGFSIAWPGGPGSYAIATFSYVMVRQDLRDLGAAGCAIKAFLRWAHSDEAQANAIVFDLVPLPKEILAKNLIAINQIQVVDEATVDAYLAMMSDTIVIQDKPLVAAAASPRLFVALLLFLIALVVV